MSLQTWVPSKPLTKKPLGRSRIVELLKPVVQAYIIGLLASVGPRVIGVVVSVLRRKSNTSRALEKILAALHSQTQIDQLPSSYAILAGGSWLLPRLIQKLLHVQPSILPGLRRRSTGSGTGVLIFICSFCASLLSFQLLNRKKSQEEEFRAPAPAAIAKAPGGVAEPVSHQRSVSYSSNGDSTEYNAQGEILLAGQTLGFTLFALVRAVDICAKMFWEKRQKRRFRSTGASRFVEMMETIAAPATFALSCSVIMWAWFFAPHRLPPSYARFISSAAQIDPRLIKALRECRYGNFVYGKDTGMAPLLEGFCRELGYPEVWGDPAKTVPIPCELYHSGTGPSCEWHGIVRFFRAYLFAMRMYLPLNSLVLLRRPLSRKVLTRILVEADRSSTFLAAFITLFYYGVCLTRTRIGPKLFSRETFTPMMCDGGACVGTGCLLCGWSILIEQPARQSEFALFVAPRALATILPRRYDRKYMLREQVVFASSVALILTTAQIKPERIRGILGKVLTVVIS